jgi:hypothetical protein
MPDPPTVPVGACLSSMTNQRICFGIGGDGTDPGGSVHSSQESDADLDESRLQGLAAISLCELEPLPSACLWTAPGCPPVVLYRIEGGGHGWPGGPQVRPARFTGPIPRHLDAAGILLEMV